MEEIVEKYLGIKDAKIIKNNIGTQNDTYIVNGQYILKIFNKDAIRSEYEREIRETKEQVAEIVKNHGIDVILPYKYNGRYIQKKGVYFCIYPYRDYKSVSKDEIKLEHVQELARIIRTLHELKLEVPLPKNNRVKFNIDFDKYIFYHRNNKELYTLLINNKAKLEKLESRINMSLDNLKGRIVVSHNDLKLENVLWNTFNAHLIDWDAAGYINHMCAANEYAYFWSVNKGELNKEYYKNFMKLYMAKHECNDNIYDVIYATLYGKFSWLQYSLERSMYQDLDEAAKGIEAILGLIKEFSMYEKNIPEMVSIFNTLDDKFNE